MFVNPVRYEVLPTRFDEVGTVCDDFVVFHGNISDRVGDFNPVLNHLN